jgi:RNA polymerase sigma-B factor
LTGKSNVELAEVEADEVRPAAPEASRPTYEVSATSATRHAEFDRLFKLWRETGDPRLRDRLILMNRNLVSFVARKFMDRGEMSEDIIQQGLIGLINALDHFDPTRGARFATFATPTIMGEIRRYLRDKTWGVRVPRRLHELNMLINSRIETLTVQFDRSPTYAEIARALGLELEEVIEALEMVHALEPVSIDETLPTAQGETAMSIGEQIGAEDADLEGWNDHALLQAALEKLPERERQVLHMAYFEEKSQTEIARHLKVSQMNISRLQRRALAHLRELMNSSDF